MKKRILMGQGQQIFSVATGLATLLTALIWGAYGGIMPEVAHAHEGEAEAPMTAGEFSEQVQQYVSARPTDEEGFVRADHRIPISARAFSFTPSKITVEAGEQYELAIASTDVTHGFRLEFSNGSKTWQVPPGPPIEVPVMFSQPGEYTVVCDVYCGVGHHEMSATFKVVPATGDDEHAEGDEHAEDEHAEDEHAEDEEAHDDEH